MKEPKISDLRFDARGTQTMRKNAQQTKKVKITINVDADLIKAAKKLAKESDIPYQRLINKLLRQATKEARTYESRLEQLEKEVSKLKRQRVA